MGSRPESSTAPLETPPPPPPPPPSAIEQFEFIKSTKPDVTNYATLECDSATDTLLFLACLAGCEPDSYKDVIDNEVFCFQTIAEGISEGLAQDESIKPGKNTHRSGTIRQYAQFLMEKNALENGGHCGIYVTVNKVDGKGRQAKNIEKVNALYIDLDAGDISQADLEDIASKYSPTMIVQSSPGKAHIYWCLEEPENSEDISKQLTNFRINQQLVQSVFKDYGVDEKIVDLPRIMRVPGFLHQKNPANPSTVKLLWCSFKRYSIREVFGLLDIDEPYIIHAKNLGWIDDPLNPGTGAGNASLSSINSSYNNVVDKSRENYGQYLGASQGSRNDALFHYALQHCFKHKGLNEKEGYALCALVNVEQNEPPLPLEEVKSVVKSAYGRYQTYHSESYKPLPPGKASEVLQAWGGEEKEFTCKWLRASGVEIFENLKFDYDTSSADWTNPISDSSILDRIVQKYGDRLGISPNLGVYAYDTLSGIWQNDVAAKSGEAYMRALIGPLLAAITKEDRVKGHFLDSKSNINWRALRSFERDLFSLKKLKQILEMMEYRQDLHVDFQEFDTKIGVIPTLSGAIDLTTGDLLEHSPEIKFTRRLPLEFDPDAEAPRWLQFIDEIMGGDEELKCYLQKITGLVLAGDTSEQCMFLLYGTGGNGKSIFLNLMREVMGSFSAEFPAPTLLKTHNYSSNALMGSFAQAYGKRLVGVAEIDEHSAWDEMSVKSLSGNDTIVGKYLYKNSFEYMPTFVTFVRANHKPKISGSDAAIWDRFRIIPFMQKFRGTDRQDPYLQNKLKLELSGIFNWMSEGYRMFLSEGLEAPISAKHFMETYRDTMNPWRQFILEYCELCEIEDGLSPQEFCAAYNKWASNEGVDRLAKNTITGKLQSLGIEYKRLSLPSGKRSRVFNIKLSEKGGTLLSELRPDKISELFPD